MPTKLQKRTLEAKGKQLKCKKIGIDTILFHLKVSFQVIE